MHLVILVFRSEKPGWIVLCVDGLSIQNSEAETGTTFFLFHSAENSLVRSLYQAGDRQNDRAHCGPEIVLCCPSMRNTPSPFREMIAKFREIG